MTKCGAVRLPTTLAPGKSVLCTFVPRNANSFGGATWLGVFPVPVGVDDGQGPYATLKCAALLMGSGPFMQGGLEWCLARCV